MRGQVSKSDKAGSAPGFGEEVDGFGVVADVERRAHRPRGAGVLQCRQVAAEVVDGAVQEMGSGAVTLELLGGVGGGAGDQDLAAPRDLARHAGSPRCEPLTRQTLPAPTVRLP